MVRYFILLLTLFTIAGWTACGEKEQPSHSGDKTFKESGHPLVDKLSDQLEKNPKDASLWHARGNAFYDLEVYRQAISDYREAVQLDSTEPQYRHDLADAYLDNVQSRKALETMEQTAALFPERIPTLLKLSEFQLILKQYEDGYKTLDRILALDPQNAEAYLMRGMMYKDQDYIKSARQALEQAVAIDPDLVDGWIMLGEIADRQNEPVAGKYYDNALRMDPKNINAIHGKALWLQERGELKQAIELYGKIIGIERDYTDAYYNAGLLYMEMDSVEKAREHFNLAVQSDPTFAKGYYYRGLAKEHLGDLSGASQDYDQALRFSPSDRRARQALERLQQ